MKQDFDVAIIGSGVAGMTAAIYLKRSGINCCILEREVPGGQINKASSVRNYPGFTEITGPDLSKNIFEQVNDLGIVYKYGNVLKISIEDGCKIIKTDIEEITAKNIIIAALSGVLAIHITGFFYMLLVSLIRHENSSYIMDWLLYESLIRAVYDFVLGVIFMFVAKFFRKFIWILTSI